ncbi:MAG: gliding motility lipoprotein GldH [Prevotella sp.]|nr:gliding motility lipoprotein GldH [Prevotella sp.]
MVRLSSSKNIVVAVAAAALACLAAACKQQVAYSHYEHVAPAGWDKEDAMAFSNGRVAADGEYTERVGVCISDDYPFTDMTLIVEHTLYPALKTWSDTVYCRLIDDNGNAVGPGISQHQYEFDVRHLKLYAGDSLHVGVAHNMKRETLPGILSVGVTIVRNDSDYGWRRAAGK